MRVVVDIPDEYYRALKNCEDDTLLADSLLIKYGEPLFDVISKLPLQGMTDVLDKIRAEIEQRCCITVGRENDPAITLHDVFQIIDKYKAEVRDKECI